jgi:hypothetical protein
MDLSLSLVIARQWFAGWEREAAELRGHMNRANTQGSATDASDDGTPEETNAAEHNTEKSNED